MAVGAARAAVGGRTTLTVPPSSRRRSWERRSSSPAAIRPAIVSVGLVSPRSTWESIGAETPERSARSRSERSIDSRSAPDARPPLRSRADVAIRRVRYRVHRIGSRAAPRTLSPSYALDRPDVLVLAAGGTLGEAWMRGLLDGAGTGGGDRLPRVRVLRRDLRRLVRRRLSSPPAARPTRAPRPAPLRTGPTPPSDNGDRRRFPALGRLTAAAAAPLAPIALALGDPRRRRRACGCAAGPRRGTKRSMPGLGRLIDAQGARFDGRLRVVAVDRRSGRRVVFGAPGAPPATGRRGGARVLLGAVASSRPWGSAAASTSTAASGAPRTSTPRPPAAAREVLCLNPTASLPASRRRSARCARSRAPPRSRRRWRCGRAARRCARSRPDARAAEAMGVNLMDRGRVDAVLAAGYAQGRALAA